MAALKTFGWGVIGAGRHAERFIAPAMTKSKTSRLAAVFSRDLARAREFASIHECASAYDKFDQLLEDKAVNGVFVCSPNHVHKEQVIQAASTNKHVLCEKPLALNAADCLAMIHASRSAGIRLAVGFHLRHNPAHLAARDIVSSGVLGEIVFAEVQYMHIVGGAEPRGSAPWRQDPKIAGGGSFLSTGTHALDLLRFILKKEVTQVSAMADEKWQETGIERLIQVSLRFQGGLIAQLSAGAMKYPQNDLVLCGNSGTLRCVRSIGNYGGGSLEVVSDRGKETTHFDPCDVYERELDGFVAAVNGEEDISASGMDGYQAARVSEAAYTSLRTRAAIDLSITL